MNKKESGMGAYDGAEVCELAGSFLRHELSHKHNKDISLYRDDGLAVFKNKNGSQTERIEKDFKVIFLENDLNIAIKCNQKIVDYSDITLNLLKSSYKPFSESNNEINYKRNPTTHRLYLTKQVSFSLVSRLPNSFLK